MRGTPAEASCLGQQCQQLQTYKAELPLLFSFNELLLVSQIRSGNVVTATQVANARIESKNRGAQGEVQAIGWLARFFLSVIPF